MELSIRQKGFIKLLLGTLLGIAAAYLLYALEESGTTINGFYLISIAAPAAWGLGGVLGLFVVILSFALMISAVAIAGYFELI